MKVAIPCLFSALAQRSTARLPPSELGIRITAGNAGSCDRGSLNSPAIVAGVPPVCPIRTSLSALVVVANGINKT